MKKLLSIAVSFAILLLIYSQLDKAAFGAALMRTDPFLLGLSLVILVLLIFASALRLKQLGAAAEFPITANTAIQTIFAANALNLLLPGKLGDVLKASLMAADDKKRLPTAIALGIWEKLSELALLFLLAAPAFALQGGQYQMAAMTGLAGSAGLTVLLWSPPLRWLPRGSVAEIGIAWTDLLRRLRSQPQSTIRVLLMSSFIWLTHLLQICIMVAALGVSGNVNLWLGIVALLPIAIFAGLLPLTFAGVGTRDAALVLLLGPSIGAETAAALGVLFWLRYLVPGLLGIYFLPRFFRVAAQHAWWRTR